MRHTYVVTYDICDPRRLRKVYKAMLGWGEHLQLSVFQCELNERELIELRVELDRLINHADDQILFVDVGVTTSGAANAIQSLGRAYSDPERVALVV